jgi:predicted nuclease of predicted toxin-antitoxin system
MSRLFIELYLDEDFAVLVADLMQARGFSAITTHDAGNAGKSDVEQLAYAVSQQYTMLTHNRVDFEQLAEQYAQAGMTHYGIIIAVRRSPFEITNRLLTIVNVVTADEIENQLRYI